MADNKRFIYRIVYICIRIQISNIHVHDSLIIHAPEPLEKYDWSIRLTSGLHAGIPQVFVNCRHQLRYVFADVSSTQSTRAHVTRQFTTKSAWRASEQLKT